MFAARIVGPSPQGAADGSAAGETYLFGQLRLTPDALSAGLKYVLYFAAVLGAGRWWKAAARDRRDRFTMLPPLAAAFWGTVLMFLWPWQPGQTPVVGGIVPLVLAAVAVQAASAWTPPPPPAPKRLRFRPA